MLFCQFAKSQSLRNISNGLRSVIGNLNHMGVYKAPSKSTISYQNKRRDWEFFRAYYYSLLESLWLKAHLRRVKFKIRSKKFLLDSTTVSTCQSLFDRAKYKTAKGVIKCTPYLIKMSNCQPTWTLPTKKQQSIKGLTVYRYLKEV